jgi:glycyl-tRNA synthetase alpha subunit
MKYSDQLENICSFMKHLNQPSRLVPDCDRYGKIPQRFREAYILQGSIDACLRKLTGTLYTSSLTLMQWDSQTSNERTQKRSAHRPEDF